MQVVGPLSVLENIFVADGNVLSVRSCTGLLAPLTALLSLSCASLSRPGSSLSSSSSEELKPAVGGAHFRRGAGTDSSSLDEPPAVGGPGGLCVTAAAGLISGVAGAGGRALGACGQAVTCQRCGFTNMDHEDMGRWVEGDPQLLDENGDGWRFVNAVDGVRKQKMEPPRR